MISKKFILFSLSLYLSQVGYAKAVDNIKHNHPLAKENYITLWGGFYDTTKENACHLAETFYFQIRNRNCFLKYNLLNDEDKKYYDEAKINYSLKEVDKLVKQGKLPRVCSMNDKTNYSLGMINEVTKKLDKDSSLDGKKKYDKLEKLVIIHNKLDKDKKCQIVYIYTPYDETKVEEYKKKCK